MRFEFSEYIKQHWDADEFCHWLAEEARERIIEMAMGTQKIADPKFGVVHDEDDYKFLSQFPYSVWSQALNWRYNQGLRDLMRMSKGRTHIPEDRDWVKEIKFPVSAGKFYRFHNPDGKLIYTGLSHLAKKLTKPAKGRPWEVVMDPENPDVPHPHWEEGGPALSEINPHEKDENNPNHPKHYKHGHYDLDLADMAEVSDEDIDKIPDQDIQALLGPPLSQMSVKMPEVQNAIAKIRAKMKKVKKHTFSAYNVPQIGTTQDNISDWLNANALGLYGSHGHGPGDEYYDELTKQKYTINKKTPAQMSALYKQAFKKKGGDEEEDYSLRHDIPTIDKPMTYDELDKEGNVIDSHVNKITTIPHLNAQKGIPQLHKAEGSMKITPEQRLQIAQFRARENPKKWDAGAWKLSPGEKLPEAIKRWGDAFKTASKIDTFKNFIKFWDIWTDQQKAWIRQNAKSLVEMSKKVHAKEGQEDIKAKLDAYKARMKKGEQLSPVEMAEFDALEKEQLSKPQHLYIAGPRPNYLSQGQGVLNIPKDKMPEFKAKYLPLIEKELEGSSGMIETILQRMAKDPKYPPQVIAALESRVEPLTTFAAYNLLTWLNDPQYGVGSDPEFNLLVDKEGNPVKMDSEENKIRRFWKVEWFLKSAAQIGFNDVLSRRRREKGGMGLVGTLDAPVGDTGKTGAGQVTAGQKPKEILELPAKRRWLNSDPGSVARAGQKTHSLLTGLSNQFFAQRRQQLLRKLQGMPEVESDLKKAEKEIDQALQMAIELYQKYDKELEASIPDELQREAEIMKKVHAALSTHESVSHLGIEDVLSKAKTLIAAGKTTADDMQIKQAMDDWMTEFLKTPENKPINIPAWNETTKKAVSTGATIVPSDLPAHPHAIAQVIAHVYQNRPKLVLDALKQWGGRAYEKVVDMHDDVEKESSQLQQEWQEEVAYWEEKFATEFKYKEPGQPTQMPPATAAAQPAAAQAPAVAAKALGQTLPELFNWAGKIGSIEDMLRIGHALLAKRNELMAQKGSAAQLEQAIDAMRERRKFIKAESSPQEYMMMNQLMHLQSDLEAAHE